MASSMRAAASGSGHRVGPASTSAEVTASGSTLASRWPTLLTQPNTSMPAVASSCRATAAAATRPTVSRAEARPPPAACTPYLAS
ncbi:MAG: hypothetical protein R2704_16835 [Microthrixaceae bacterium]